MSRTFPWFIAFCFLFKEASPHFLLGYYNLNLLGAYRSLSQGYILYMYLMVNTPIKNDQSFKGHIGPPFQGDRYIYLMVSSSAENHQGLRDRTYSILVTLCTWHFGGFGSGAISLVPRNWPGTFLKINKESWHHSIFILYMHQPYLVSMHGNSHNLLMHFSQ